MRLQVKKYLSQIRLSLINKLDYRQELLMTLFIGFIVFAGQYFFWKMAFAGDSQTTIKGYSFTEIIQYYLLLRIVSDIVDSRVGFRIGEMVLNGKISFLLLKPITLKKWLIAEEIGRVVVDLLTKALFFSESLILL